MSNLFISLILSTMVPVPPYLILFLSDVPDPDKGNIINELKAALFPA
jgi:hypothetical protein